MDNSRHLSASSHILLNLTCVVSSTNYFIWHRSPLLHLDPDSPTVDIPTSNHPDLQAPSGRSVLCAGHTTDYQYLAEFFVGFPKLYNLVCCIIPPARLEHARALHILDYTAPAPMSTSLLYVATLILTSCTVFFHFSEHRCSPNIRLKAENAISTSHLLLYSPFFHSSRKHFSRRLASSTRGCQQIRQAAS